MQTAELSGPLAHSDALVAILRDQLTSKDRQQADQVSQLIGRLGHVGDVA